MSRASLGFRLWALGSGLSLLLFAPPAGVSAFARQDLPDGPGKAVVARLCDGCHDLTFTMSTRETEEEWTRIVNDMRSRGTDGTEEEFAQVIAYLTAHMGKAEPQHVTAEGQAMAVFAGPLTVGMGSPAGEHGRQPASDSAAEPLHTVTIPRSFAIGTTEVTVAQFRRFLDANPEAKRGYQFPGAPSRMADLLARFSPDDDSPAIAMTWYEAAMYCNWLSAREGLPESEWVYPVGVLGNGMRLPSDYLRRRGYRLPTEPEWEFAARAGTTTSRFFGDSEDRLAEYAWYSKNPPRARGEPVDPNDPQRTSPVARLKPNPFRLFDVYGNVWEWTQDRVERFQTAEVREDREDTVLTVLDNIARTRRGGAFSYEAAMARSAARGTITSLPTNRRDNVGFRIARTIR